MLLDIESAPAQAYVWGIWEQNVGLNQLIDSGRVLCWAAKWSDQDQIEFSSEKKDGKRRMMQKIHKLLNEADVVVHYNGSRYDIPILNREFLKLEMDPPAPYKQVDLLKVAKTRFKFLSNKLDFVAKTLGLGSKVRHKGFELWIECMEGKAEAWEQMEEYNRGDIILLEKLYNRVLPWIKNHPNFNLFSRDGLVCPKCGSKHYHFRGNAQVKTLTYRRAQCNDCGSWFRSNKAIDKKHPDTFVEIA